MVANADELFAHAASMRQVKLDNSVQERPFKALVVGSSPTRPTLPPLLLRAELRQGLADLGGMIPGLRALDNPRDFAVDDQK